MTIKFGVITLFPEMFDALRVGITGRALGKSLASLSLWNPRDFTEDKHKRVDDRPFGGGPGMVMMMQPLVDALKQAKAELPEAKVVYLSPQGKRFAQDHADRAAKQTQLILIAGRYEGIDQRFIDEYVDEEWCIGDAVVSGGEFPAMMAMDSIIRLIPGALGHEQSAEQDSFATGLLDCPHYTRPEVFHETSVPSVLLSGDHKAIASWRQQQALGQTWLKRPELLADKPLTAEDKKLLNEFMNESVRSVK